MKTPSKRVLTMNQQIDDIAQKMSVEYGAAVEVTHMDSEYCVVKMTDSVHNKTLSTGIPVDADLRETLGILESLYTRLIEER